MRQAAQLIPPMVHSECSPPSRAATSCCSPLSAQLAIRSAKHPSSPSTKESKPEKSKSPKLAASRASYAPAETRRTTAQIKLLSRRSGQHSRTPQQLQQAPLLLAGEIVTGGKQDRVIAKDRIVPVGAEPIDLGVFCIEPGRWTESSATFGAAAKGASHGFMAQPTVRERAMVQKDQQQVWDSVRGAISQMAVAAAPPTTPNSAGARPAPSFGTTSYAKVMQSSAVSDKVDEAAAPVMKSRDQVLAQLRQEHAVGVIVAVRGEIVWADIFADTDLLSRYWTKLVRSYAAESLTEGETYSAPSISDAQHFLDAPAGGTETSEGNVGVYRYRELKSNGTSTFVLESLLPGTDYDVHISKMKLRNDEGRAPKPHPIFSPQIYR